MADDVTVDNGGLTDYVVASDDIGSGRQAQLVKLLYGANGDATAATLDASGLLVTTAAEVTEDVAHSGGEVLIGNGVRRIDTPAVSGQSSGDWSTMDCDANGALWTRALEAPRTDKFDLVTQASAVAANDQLCDEMELTSMSLVANGGGKLNNLVLVSYNTTQIAAEGWVYQANPTPAGTNAVHNQTDANMAASFPIAVYDFSTWYTETDNIFSVGIMRGTRDPLYYQCKDGSATTSLWIVVVTRTAVTPGATTDYDLFVNRTPLV